MEHLEYFMFNLRMLCVTKNQRNRLVVLVYICVVYLPNNCLLLESIKAK